MEDLLQEKLKRNRRKKILGILLAVMIAAIITAGFVMHSANSGDGGRVSIEISCKALAENMYALKNPALRDYIPKDGTILSTQTVTIKEGETAYDVLESVCRDRQIHMESSDSATYGSRYIEGIGHLYERDAGERSGWIYEVNGEMPNVGCSQYELKDGDDIRWNYVIDYTKEVDWEE